MALLTAPKRTMVNMGRTPSLRILDEHWRQYITSRVRFHRNADQPNVAFGSKGDIPVPLAHVRFSSRPFGVKRFQTIRRSMLVSLAGSCFSSESAPRPFHHRIRRRGGTIFTAALPANNGRSKRTYELTSSIVPRGTSFHCSVDLRFPPIASILCAFRLPRFPWSSGTRCRQPRCDA